MLTKALGMSMEFVLVYYIVLIRRLQQEKKNKSLLTNWVEGLWEMKVCQNEKSKKVIHERKSWEALTYLNQLNTSCTL